MVIVSVFRMSLQFMQIFDLNLVFFDELHVYKQHSLTATLDWLRVICNKQYRVDN